MQRLSLLALLATSSLPITVLSLPLNINLGAFSPALVVGDGEISFGGEADVSNLMTALSGASQEASNNAEVQRASVVTESGPTVVEASPVEETPATESASPLPVLGIGRNVIEPRLPDADVDLVERDADIVNVEKEKRDLEVGEVKREAEERDLAGFNAALNFAAGALKTGPEIQLGTGEGGSGVGIIVKGGSESGAATTETIEKREAGNLPTVTMVKVRTVGGENSGVEKSKREVEERDPESDGVNLNLKGRGEYELLIAEVKP